MRPNGGVDPRYPEAPELAFTVVTIACRVLERVEDGLVGTTEKTMALAFVACGQGDDLLVTAPCGDATLYAAHGLLLAALIRARGLSYQERP
jgi:hypothetical protein